LTILEAIRISFNINRYKIEYYEAKDREDCINRIMKKWLRPRKIAERYFLEMNRVWKYHIKKDAEPVKEKKVFSQEFVMVPNRLKMYKLQDLKDAKIKITRGLLKRYGFEEYEINWLHNKGELK